MLVIRFSQDDTLMPFSLRGVLHHITGFQIANVDISVRQLSSTNRFFRVDVFLGVLEGENDTARPSLLVFILRLFATPPH